MIYGINLVIFCFMLCKMYVKRSFISPVSRVPKPHLKPAALGWELVAAKLKMVALCWRLTVTARLGGRLARGATVALGDGLCCIL